MSTSPMVHELGMGGARIRAAQYQCPMLVADVVHPHQLAFPDFIHLHVKGGANLIQAN